MTARSVKLQITKLALAFMVAMHTPSLLAQTTPEQSTSVQQDSPLPAEQTAMSWPMLPGESVESLATLFYPKNKGMQRRFIAKTLQLSRGVQPGLNPSETSSQANLIMIPNIKSLAKQSGSIKSAVPKNTIKHKAESDLHLSYGLKDAAQFVITPEMQAEYDTLVKKNAFLKDELERLNTKLAQLQQALAALQVEADSVMNAPPVAQAATPEPAVVVVPQPVAMSKPVETPKPEVAKAGTNPVVAKQDSVVASHPTPVAPVITEKKVEAPAKIKVITKPVTVELSAGTTSSSFLSQYLLIPILPLLLIGFFLGLYLYNRQQAQKLRFASTGSFRPLEKKAFINGIVEEEPTTLMQEVDFSLTQSGYTGNMSVVDLSGAETLDYNDEGDLILEQARIYVNLNRVDEAIALLKVQIETTPKTALHHWLYLLDIYRDTHQKEEFLHYAKQLHESFNVMMPLWENTPLPMVIASSLEEFSHITGQITDLWADETKVAETKAYLDDLLTDNRGSERTGFSMEVFQEIILLRNLLDVREKLADTED